VGFIGYGLIGKRHVLSFKQLPGVDLVAVAETHRPRREEAARFIGGGVKQYADFRRLLDDPDVDAVVVATPDHWHALMTMLACAAGKDAYVEKPLSLFVREGRWMCEVARRHGRVVQVGTQQRSGAHYARARDLIRSGRLGKITSVRMEAARNITPGFGSPPDGDPPEDLDWNMWLGPAPKRRYNPHRALYHFRWFWDYSGGQMTNLGQHQLDIVDWVLGTGTLSSVFSTGGRFALTDNGETPDTQDALFTFDGWAASWHHREASRGEAAGAGLTFYGTAGSLSISRSGFRVTADPDLPAESFVPQFGGHPAGGVQRAAPKGAPKLRTEALEDKTGDGNAQFVEHARQFIECVRSRKTPVSDLESGHRVATACHLANLSLRLGRQLRWDPQRESIPGDAAAAAMLERPYRAPWDRELKALGVR
jgi:predicted dehydrogenase